MRKYFKIENKKSDERAKLHIYDQVGKDWWSDEGVSDKDVIGWLAEADGKPLDVHINSVGGNVYEGIAIYNALKNYENDVTIYIDGIAASIASVIACASDDVRINNGATLMVHGIKGGLSVYGGEDEIKDAADRCLAAMQSCKESIVDIYESKTGMSRDDIIALMSTDSYLSAQEALDKGFCNEILNKKPDKTVENSLQNQMKSYPNEKMQAIVNRLFSIQNSAKPEPKPQAEPIKPIVNQGVNPMDPEELKEQAIADFKAAENKRQTDIKAIFGDKHPELMNQCLLDQECSPENAKDKLLDNLLNAPQPNNAQSVGSFHANVTEDQVDTKLKALKESWDNKRDGKHDGANPMNDATMHTAIALIAQKNGIETTGYSGNQFFNLLEKDMQVTSEFSVLLSDSLNKSVEKGYALAPTTFREFVKFGSFNDFRKKEVHMLGTIGDLPLKDEKDDYEQIKLPDSEAQDYAPEERGGIIVLSRKLLVNNDLGNLETQAQDAGFSGALTLNKLFHDYLFSNPALRDGKALFHADHGNLLPAGAITVGALEAMQELFDAHTAPNSPDSYLDLEADRVLADRTSVRIIRELITKETGKEAKSTIDLFDYTKLFISKRMAGQGVYFFADPNIAPVLEVGFLNGLQVPTLATEEHFNSGAMKWRLQLDCGIGAVNYRGAVWLPPVVGAEGKKAEKK